jgi:hypothetical protein
MRPVSKNGVLALVVAAHVALLWRWSPNEPSAPMPGRQTTLVVIALPPPAAAPEPRSDERVVSRPSRSKTSEPPLARAGRREAAPVFSPAPISVGPMAAAAPGSESASAPKPLDLVVRARDALRPSPLGAALNDARSNTPRPSAGERMAQTLGTDTRLREEIRPDGSVRFRQGGNCFDARESRAAGLDPYNTAIMPKPRQMSAC